jgi:hypothetical protein
MLIKLDMPKAYDMLNKIFIIQMITAFSFDDYWIR